MNMKTILALIMSALVSHIALADGNDSNNYVKLPDYNANQNAYGDDSYGADTYTEDTDNSGDTPQNQNYVANDPVQTQTYSSNDNWGQVKAACSKRDNDSYRISGQLSPLRIQIICTQYSSIDARIQAKGMNTYSVKSQPVRVHSWKKDVLCEDLVKSRYDLNVLCNPSNNNSNYDDNETDQDTQGQGQGS